jgi:hypothetical protein
MSASDYGQFYYGLELQSGTVVMLFADEVLITENGSLQFFQQMKGNQTRTLAAYTASEWKSLWAASVMDGSPVAIDQVAEVKKK